MSNKVLKKIILITIALIAIYMPKCFAAGANISTNETSVKPGGTVELYIDLSTASIGYDLKISNDNGELISKSEMVNKIGNGDATKLNLIQIAGADDRITYQPGTRIATIRYTISENATVGSTITFNVSGDVAGESSSDKNEMNESVTINIVAPTNDDEGEQDNPQTPPQGEGEGESGEQNPPQGEGEGESGEQNPPQGEGEGESGEQNPPQGEGEGESGEQNPPQGEGEDEAGPQNPPKVEDEKDNTVAEGIIPQAGIGSLAVVVAIILMVIMYDSFKKYNKNKDIK